LSAFRHVKKLPAGHSLTWRPGGQPRIERYWSLDYGPKLRLDPAEAADEVRARLLDATKVRLMSDVPIGAFLSGGVDSSAVVAAMAMSTSDVVRTFSASFPGTAVDESVYARAVAERYGTEHHELEIGPVDAGIMPRLAWHFGEPFADPAALPSFQLAELVRRHVKVALNGDGGDESFGGYRRYHQLAMTRPADVLPDGVRGVLAAGLARAAGGTEGRAPGRRAARLARRLAMHPVRRYATCSGSSPPTSARSCIARSSVRRWSGRTRSVTWTRRGRRRTASEPRIASWRSTSTRISRTTCSEGRHHEHGQLDRGAVAAARPGADGLRREAARTSQAPRARGKIVLRTRSGRGCRTTSSIGPSRASPCRSRDGSATSCATSPATSCSTAERVTAASWIRPRRAAGDGPSRPA
jgi:hypothetical protein